MSVEAVHANTDGDQVERELSLMSGDKVLNMNCLADCTLPPDFCSLAANTGAPLTFCLWLSTAAPASPVFQHWSSSSLIPLHIPTYYPSKASSRQTGHLLSIYTPATGQELLWGHCGSSFIPLPLLLSMTASRGGKVVISRQSQERSPCCTERR